MTDKKLYQSTPFLLTLLASGYLIYISNSPENTNSAISRSHANLQDKMPSSIYKNTKLSSTSQMHKENHSIEKKERSEAQIIEDEELVYAKVMMQADRLYQNFQGDDTTDEILKIQAINDALSSFVSEQNSANISDIQVVKSPTVAYSSTSQTYKNIKPKVIRLASTLSEYDGVITTKKEDSEEQSEELESKKEKREDHIEPYAGYITGSPIPTEQNQTEVAQKRVASQNLIYLYRSELFSEDSKEKEHGCEIDIEGKMICKKAITNCIAEDNAGLKCTLSYYAEGIWHEEEKALTIKSNQDWIRTHLQNNRSFVSLKFSDYFAQRYLDEGLIRPNLKATKALRLLQYKKYIQEKSYLDVGIESLLYHPQASVANSIFLRGTRFGTGHQKIEGGDIAFFEALQEFLDTFTYASDSEIYALEDYWNIMDINQSRGDSEDFALSAMEWLLINGVDPQYITLTELKDDITSSREIMLFIKTVKPSEIWVLKEERLRRVEDIFPQGYESLIINEYRYQEHNSTEMTLHEE